VASPFALNCAAVDTAVVRWLKIVHGLVHGAGSVSTSEFSCRRSAICCVTHINVSIATLKGKLGKSRGSALVLTAELEAEETEPRGLRDKLSAVIAETSRLTAERYEPLWRENVRLAERIRYWQTRLRELQTRLEELRRRGRARLNAHERREFLDIRDRQIPRAESV